MFYTITPSDMKRIETAAMDAALCTGEELMSRAAAAVARAVYRHTEAEKSVVLALCGTGNNGGDAVAALRMLSQEGCLAKGICLMLRGDLTPDARRELNRLSACPEVEIRRVEGTELPWEQILPEADRVDCIIDGLFGTGLSRPVEGTAAELCCLSNRLHRERGVPVIAVDIPSGLCGETGRVLGVAVRASETVTFHRPKPGLFLGKGPEHTERITLTDIGLHDPEPENGMAVAESGDCLFPKADKRTAHKGSNGRVILFCGSAGMAGAAAIAATAALRSGAGLVTVACPERILDTVQLLVPCATCLPLSPDADAAWAQLEGLLPAADVLGMGCGLGQSPWAAEMTVRCLGWLSAHATPGVIDADGLNLLAKQEPGAFDLSRCILTPHPGEAARLLGSDVPAVTARPAESAQQLRKRWGAAVALKGAASVLAAAEGLGLNIVGTPAMAKGGSGDALTGVLCALLARNRHAEQPNGMLPLLQTGCWLHGMAGCLAEEETGRCGMLVTDLCAKLGNARERGRRTDPLLCPDTPVNDCYDRRDGLFDDWFPDYGMRVSRDSGSPFRIPPKTLIAPLHIPKLR
ncbi:MAG: NAD(P)H-hydrate dehydratase [Clostridia bacterium]|nr:NAD(P)H-hydrate dehydratase [Clostridia bacterium]